MSDEASLEGKASAALDALEGLLGVGPPVHRLLRFELQQLGEGLPALFAAQRLALLLRCSLLGLGLHSTFGPSGVPHVTFIWILWFHLAGRKCGF